MKSFKRHSISLLAGVAVAMVGAPASVDAQAFFVDASVDQAYAADPLPSPVGFTVAAGRTSILGPLGVHVGFRTLHEQGPALDQHCGLSSCTPGPFEQSHSMRLAYFGLSYDFRNRTDVYLNLGLNVGRNHQTEHLTHMETGEESELSPDDETTLGGSVDLRLRPLVGPLRPVFSGRYDRILAADCTPDASCLPGRDVWSISVGLSWVAPIR